jgi:hypothetical protein
MYEPTPDRVLNLALSERQKIDVACTSDCKRRGMKKQSKPSAKAHVVRGALYLLLLSAGTLPAFFRPQAPANLSQRTLTFARRVDYQRAIEEVYWRHRIWPKERPDPKPSLDKVMSQAQIEKKVEDYLRDSQALEHYWHYPITAEQLQAEMDRIAGHTKQPEVLRELFETLGNDPFVIAECLARPVLAERLVTELNNEGSVKLTRIAWRKEPLQSWVAKAESQVPVTMAALSATYTLPVIGSLSGVCTDDTWTPSSTTGAPSARQYHTALWTGSEMIVWGGYDGTNAFNTGGRYNPSTDSWTATSITNAPSGRLQHKAVWTGSEMIVWGGWSGGSTYLNTGGRYNPGTDTWTATSITGAPAARAVHTAVWTGSEMIVWGGDICCPIAFNTGGRYNPSTDSWIATTTTNAPTARLGHTAAWTGSEMIIWGGYDGDSYFNTGGRYNPTTDNWAATGLTNAPTDRYFHTAVWTGSEMIVWGGDAGFPPNIFNTGGRYNPNTDSWTATSTTSAPVGRAYHTAVWTGDEMIVWGGAFYDGTWHYFNTGGRYCAQSGPTPTPTPTPIATSTPTATPTPTPTPTPCTGRCAPTPRARPSPAPRP